VAHCHRHLLKDAQPYVEIETLGKLALFFYGQPLLRKISL